MKRGQILVVTGVVVCKNRVLLVQRSEKELKAVDGKWELPGGKIGFNETPAQALKREILEETGCEVKPLALLPYVHISYWQYPSFHQKTTIIGYGCRLLRTVDSQVKDHHVMKSGWFSFEDVAKMETLPGVSRFIEIYRASFIP